MLRNEFPFRKMKEGLDFPSVAPEDKTKGIPRRQMPAHTEEGCSHRADRQQHRPPPRKGAEALVQGDAERSVVLDVFRIEDSSANLMRAVGRSSQANSQTRAHSHTHTHAQFCIRLWSPSLNQVKNVWYTQVFRLGSGTTPLALSEPVAFRLYPLQHCRLWRSSRVSWWKSSRSTLGCSVPLLLFTLWPNNNLLHLLSLVLDITASSKFTAPFVGNRI